MKYLHIKNLEEYNPGYKDRDLIWCKAYFKMINYDPDFELLCEIDKWRFMAFVMLELQMKKFVTLDEEYLTRKGFDFKKRPLKQTLEEISGSVEFYTDLMQLVRDANVTEESKPCNAGVTQSRVEKSREEKSILYTESNSPASEKPSKVFVPPSIGEVQQYCQERGNNIDAEVFVAHYEANGWMRGKTKISSWKACVVTWEKRDSYSGNKLVTSGPGLA